MKPLTRKNNLGIVAVERNNSRERKPDALIAGFFVPALRRESSNTIPERGIAGQLSCVVVTSRHHIGHNKPFWWCLSTPNKRGYYDKIYNISQQSNLCNQAKWLGLGKGYRNLLLLRLQVPETVISKFLLYTWRRATRAWSNQKTESKNWWRSARMYYAQPSWSLGGWYGIQNTPSQRVSQVGVGCVGGTNEQRAARQAHRAAESTSHTFGYPKRLRHALRHANELWREFTRSHPLLATTTILRRRFPSATASKQNEWAISRNGFFFTDDYKQAVTGRNTKATQDSYLLPVANDNFQFNQLTNSGGFSASADGG